MSLAVGLSGGVLSTGRSHGIAQNCPRSEKTGDAHQRNSAAAVFFENLLHGETRLPGGKPLAQLGELREPDLAVR